MHADDVKCDAFVPCQGLDYFDTLCEKLHCQKVPTSAS